MDVKDQPHVQTALPRGSNILCQSNRRVCGPQSRCGSLGKGVSHFPNRFRTFGSSNPQLSSYTNYANQASSN